MLPEYLPFFWCIMLGCVNELLTSVLFYQNINGTASANIYVLAEACLLTWQFQKWKLFRRNPRLFYYILAAGLLLWVLETIVFGSIHRISSWFRIIYSFALVLMSVSYLNQLFVSPHSDLLRHSGFLITSGCIVFFVYKSILEVFWLYGLNDSQAFQLRVYLILHLINIIINLLFAYALLWTDRKQPFFMQF